MNFDIYLCFRLGKVPVLTLSDRLLISALSAFSSPAYHALYQELQPSSTIRENSFKFSPSKNPEDTFVRTLLKMLTNGWRTVGHF